MHELSLAEGILEIVERTARANDVKRVRTVRIAVGELAGVDIPSLEFAWESVRKGGVAATAPLAIERPAGEAWCMTCEATVPLKQYGDACPKCGGFRLMATGGTEMRVLEIIEATDDQGPPA
ncbi:hydrogenase maturation nickel metallochaperone HypA [Sutterella sp.]|uniref:hydrogenase maturation nickel metallochaperone HypA n=1 Tax=Sutterella sp. TaxID=1981025 RepID=UPI0026DFC972|nr:hydrogenase maturation nickel metallochaperone HypA [Sutterella sp.]MDO5530918.1 hydrogenase maturation nickel metallochaperone HypA [Sutterella sp.]